MGSTCSGTGAALREPAVQKEIGHQGKARQPGKEPKAVKHQQEPDSLKVLTLQDGDGADQAESLARRR